MNASHELMVSVRLMTYNQENYIAQAIESALNQHTDFGYEIVIGDDFSTDRTAEFAQEYQARFSERIRVLHRDKHLGRLSNFVDILKNCTGKYVALLDGDDYWTDPYKLQKQVDFLEAHSECAMCFHDVEVLREATSPTVQTLRPSHRKDTYTLQDLLIENFIPTMAVMFRNGLIGELPSWYNGLALGDWPLHILSARYGRIGYIGEIMAVYRVHAGGVWSSVGDIEHLQAILEVYDCVRSHLGSDFDHVIGKCISNCCLEIGAAYADKGQVRIAKQYLMRSIREAPINSRFVDQGVLFARLYTPSIYSLTKTLTSSHRPFHVEE